MRYQYKREPLPPDEANRLANSCESHKEKLIVWTLLDTGLRVSELAELTKNNIDWQNHRLTRQQYQKSLEIKEKLGDLSGMANSYGQMGLLMRQLDRDQDAFSLFLQAFLIFSRLQAPAAQQAFGGICKVARDHLEKWQEWLSEHVDDDNSRSQIEEMILQNLDSETNKPAETLMRLKKAYEKMGEKKFLALYKEQTGEDLPDQVLEILRSDESA